MTLYSIIGFSITGVILASGILFKLYIKKRVKDYDGFVGVAKAEQQKPEGSNEAESLECKPKQKTKAG